VFIVPRFRQVLNCFDGAMSRGAPQPIHGRPHGRSACTLSSTLPVVPAGLLQSQNVDLPDRIMSQIK
jgi:hypothetical protein